MESKYEKTSLLELYKKIVDEGPKSIDNKLFNMMGIPFGVSRENFEDTNEIEYSSFEYVLYHGNEFAIVEYEIPKDEALDIEAVLKASGQTNRPISIDGMVMVEGKNNPQIRIMSHGFELGKFRSINKWNKDEFGK